MARAGRPGWARGAASGRKRRGCAAGLGGLTCGSRRPETGPPARPASQWARAGLGKREQFPFRKAPPPRARIVQGRYSLSSGPSRPARGRVRRPWSPRPHCPGLRQRRKAVPGSRGARPRRHWPRPCILQVQAERAGSPATAHAGEGEGESTRKMRGAQRRACERYSAETASRVGFSDSFVPREAEE